MLLVWAVVKLLCRIINDKYTSIKPSFRYGSSHDTLLLEALHMPDAPELVGRLKYMLLMTKKASPCAEN